MKSSFPIKCLRNATKCTTLYEAIYPLYISSKLSGTLPYVYDKKRKCYRKSKILLASIVMFTAIFTILFLVTSTESTVDFTDNSISNLSGWFELYSAVLLISVAISMNCIYRNKLVKMFKKIETIDLNLSQLGVKVEYNRLYYLSIIGLVLSWVELGVTLPTDYFFFLKDESPLYIITSYAPITINGFTKVQYVLFVYMLKERYLLINNRLISIKNKLMFEPYPFEATCLMEYVNLIKQTYGELTKLIGWINRIYGVQAVITFVNAFSITATQSYLIYDNIVKLFYDSNSEYIVNIYFAIQWSGLQLMEIFLYVYYCNVTVAQAKQTPKLIHELYCFTSERTVKIMLKLISTHMLHKKIKFTACDMFVIENCVLQATFGAITAYLVVMIQYDLSKHS